MHEIVEKGFLVIAKGGENIERNSIVVAELKDRRKLF